MTTTYTDTQLKQCMAKMLPDEIYFNIHNDYVWLKKQGFPSVLDTELLHLCWLVEETLNSRLSNEYVIELYNSVKRIEHSSWQQRTIALAKTKGIEI